MHGYDIVDHNSLNPEVGSAEDYEFFVGELHKHGMGQILDIVPNHMGVMGSDNAWWLDVLENGEAGVCGVLRYRRTSIKGELQGKVLVPVLEDQYGNVLERGELKLTFDTERGEFNIFTISIAFDQLVQQDLRGSECAIGAADSAIVQGASQRIL